MDMEVVVSAPCRTDEHTVYLIEAKPLLDDLQTATQGCSTHVHGRYKRPNLNLVGPCLQWE